MTLYWDIDILSQHYLVGTSRTASWRWIDFYKLLLTMKI